MFQSCNPIPQYLRIGLCLRTLVYLDFATWTQLKIICKTFQWNEFALRIDRIEWYRKQTKFVFELIGSRCRLVRNNNNCNTISTQFLKDLFTDCTFLLASVFLYRAFGKTRQMKLANVYPILSKISWTREVPDLMIITCTL